MKRIVPSLLAGFIWLGVSAQIDDPASYQPMPVPKWTAPVNPAVENHFIKYDPQTQEEIILPDNKENAGSMVGQNEPYNPGIPEMSEEFPGMKNFSDLSIISDPSPYPWCTNVKLFMTFDGSNFVGSGVMINERYVITAGHCVYSHSHGGWADQITIAPAYHGGIYPYGSTTATNMYSWTSWTVSQDYDWDMGYIELSQNMGTQTGWLGYAYNVDNNFYSTNTFHNPGYPAESPYDGSQMYYWYGNYDNIQTHLLYYTKYCYGGQSGSGSYYKDGSDHRYVHAVLSHQLGAETGHVRITSDKFNSIYNRINSIPENSLQGDQDLQIYPNPCNDQLNIAWTSQAVQIVIRNMMGEVVFMAPGALAGNSLDVSELPPACYTLQCIDDDHISTTRFIINR